VLAAAAVDADGTEEPPQHQVLGELRQLALGDLDAHA
jgi:hypothetical protein